MKPMQNMKWKVRVLWKGEEQEWETEGHIGKYILFIKSVLKGCEILERWQEPC